MTDAALQKKLDQLATIANELVAEAQSRFGRNGQLFYESEGAFHIMDGDCDGASVERQSHIRFSSRPHCRMDCGAW